MKNLKKFMQLIFKKVGPHLRIDPKIKIFMSHTKLQDYSNCSVMTPNFLNFYEAYETFTKLLARFDCRVVDIVQSA